MNLLINSNEKVNIHFLKMKEFVEELQNKIVQKFTELDQELPVISDNNVSVIERFWNYQHGNGNGKSVLMKSGKVLEKCGVNISAVNGELGKDFAKELKIEENASRKFSSVGLSLVFHMLSPYVPAIHMNVRMIMTEDKFWFGGVIDLNPTYACDKESADSFFLKLQELCNAYDENAYSIYRKNCDEYFFIRHRNELRGIGGIFYDYLNSGNIEKDFAFTTSIGSSFIEIFEPIVRRNALKKWGEEERNTQLQKRGRYAEFNLVYDRGTKFGLHTGADAEAILMSLPPIATWA